MKMKKTISAVVAFILSGTVNAHDSGNIAINNEKGKLVVRSVNTGKMLTKRNAYATMFTTEREWDEREIYANTNPDGTPVDFNGNEAYFGGEGLPHLKTSDSTQNERYDTNDFVWKYYENAFFLPVPLGVDSSFGNQKITFNPKSNLFKWNNRKNCFGNTRGEYVSISTWHWTNTQEDNVQDQYDDWNFPNGGWYAYPVDTVYPMNRAGINDFAPGDHWLFQLTSNTASKNREKGIYLLAGNISVQSKDIKPSNVFYILAANGLGEELKDVVNNPEFVNANQALGKRSGNDLLCDGMI